MTVRRQLLHEGRGRIVASVAWTMLVAGLIVAVLASVMWHRSVTERHENALTAQVSSARAIVRTEVQRDADLLALLAGAITSNPTMDNQQFLDLYESAEIVDRFPGGLGVSFIEVVPSADLGAFIARQDQDPVTGQDTGAGFTVYPDTPADVYCLQRFGVWERTDLAEFTVPAGFNYCATEIPGLGASTLPAQLEASVLSGEPVAVAPQDLTPGVMATFAAVYEGGIDPGTPEGRAEALRGWVAISTAAEQLVDPAVAAAPNTEMTVTYAGATGTQTIASGGGVVADDARTITVPVSDDGLWALTVTGSPGFHELDPSTQALLVLAGGVTISALVFLLVWTLAGSRRRALEMVDKKTEQLEYQALHDPLTELPNRLLLTDRATQMVARQSRHGGSVAALFVDLDNFKAINDTLGHGAGDRYLQAVAARLVGIIRDADTVGRLGGDEFLVLAEDPPGPEGATMIAQRILDVLHEPIEIDGTKTPVSCSIGVATGSYESAESLIQDADLAMYQAKSDGKGRVVVFEPAMHQAALDRTSMEWELAGALERDELFVVYQPTFDLRSGATTGVEALLRWNHPARGVVGPLEFIPIAEDTNLIIPIGRWVLRTACAQASEWASRGIPVRMAVNLSGKQLDDESIVDDVRSALTDSGLPADMLTLEITESTLMRDTGRTQSQLRALKTLGVRLAIDDFGTGYSSMAYLQQFDVDAIKIDRAFIVGLSQNDESHALIHTLIQLGKALKVETLAEGIEDSGQLDQLIREECDAGQGFLYARPLRPEDLERFLSQHVVHRTVDSR